MEGFVIFFFILNEGWSMDLRWGRYVFNIMVNISFYEGIEVIRRLWVIVFDIFWLGFKRVMGNEFVRVGVGWREENLNVGWDNLNLFGR